MIGQVCIEDFYSSTNLYFTKTTGKNVLTLIGLLIIILLYSVS